MMDEFELELKRDFITESIDLLEAAESAFLRLESDREDASLLDEIFRLAHNLKGTSKAVGFDQLADLTHAAENLILMLKEGELVVTDSIVSVLLEFKDKITEMIEGLKSDMDAKFEIVSLKNKLNEVAAADQSAEIESQKNKEEEKTNEVEASSEEVVKEEVKTEEPSVVSDKKEEAVQAKAEPVKKSPPIAKPQAKQADKDESIRVSLSKINKINDIIGELVILQTVISQRRFSHIEDDLANKSIGIMGKLFKEVQESAMSLRMLPLKTTFQKMNRIVRDTSKLLNKDVKLHLIGEDTEIDKTVMEKIGDPLVHIVRNAVDHGIEDLEARAESGKDKVGNVELWAYHEGSNLVIQVTDDGKGIDPEAIRKKAIDKNIISESDKISDTEIIQFIFHPGFSMKQEVTEISGRGVGMDVVKTNIEALGGEVKLMSKLGEGSSLKIILPLTLAIIEGIVIKVQGEKFVIPLTQVHEIAQISSDEIENFSNIAHLFKLRGEVLPLFFINKKLGAKVEEKKSQTVVVVRGLSHAFGVVIDDILNQQQIVIKKLGYDIRNMKGIVGSSIMSDGKPSLIVDLLEIFRDDIKKSKSFQQYKLKLNTAC